MGKLKSQPIRVLVIDLDSPLRDALIAFLESSTGIEVAGVGASGRDAPRLTQRLHPNIVVIGTALLGPSSVRAIRQIMHNTPTRVIIMADPLPEGAYTEGAVADSTFEALQAGALTVVVEPVPSVPATYSQFLETVRLMADVPVVHHWARSEQPSRDEAARTAVIDKVDWATRLQRTEIIGIAASTGGPAAVTEVLRALPATFPLPIILVQHVTYGFGAGLRKWLDGQTSLEVRLAHDGQRPAPGTVLLSPDDHHLAVTGLGKITLSQEPPYKGLRPSANYLFGSLARVYGPRAMGIVLTGMGDDGADGLAQLHAVGGMTLAQDENSSVVYGMPYEAVNRSAVDQVLNLDEIAALLTRLLKPAPLPAITVSSKGSHLVL